MTTVAMGQKLLDPPTVEGWHTGKEWIDGGMLVERVNFAVEEIGDGSDPGIARLIERLIESGALATPGAFVDGALDALGPIAVDETTREGLLSFAEDSASDDDRTRVLRMLRLIASTPDFQFA